MSATGDQQNVRLQRFDDVRQLIGSPANPTPLVRLNHVVPEGVGPLYLKLEWYNPFGSIKDRTALYLLKGLAERSELEGKRIVEPTSGNTGIALAALAAIMGLPISVAIPDEVPEEKKTLLRMLGAEVWETPDDLCPINHPKDGAIALARSFVESEATRDKYVMPNQYENPDNVKAHYETTGPEIWEQTEGAVRNFFAGFGTCGTITGIGKYLKEQDASIQVIAIEPNKGHRIPGMKNMFESKQPGILDRSVIDDVIRIDDETAYAMTKRLFREEGLIVGPSTGAIVAAAVQVLQANSGLSVAISPDSGFKYASFFTDILGNDGIPG
ncbi:MAG: cysteine synthase family protein, partial [bacterium]